MKIHRLAVLPVAVLLTSCGGGSDEDAVEPVLSDPGNQTPALDDRPASTPVVVPVSPIALPTSGPGEGPSSGSSGDPGSDREPGAGEGPDAGAGSDTDADADRPAETPPTPTDGASTPDPMTQNSVRLDVDITVPAYVSDQLRVDLFWGERRIRARWVGDEFWTATGDFPADEEHPLVVEFYDRNGEITLGRVERTYRTGTNGAEALAIVADDFDTGSFDDDSDGVGNLDELLLGTDPLVADDPGQPVPTDVVEVLGLVSTIGEGSGYYESRFLELDLPALDRTEAFVDRLPSSSETTVVEVDFSIDGDGTFRERYDFFIAWDEDYSRESNGTRLRRENSIRWTGTEEFDGGSYVNRRIFTFDVTTTLNDGVMSQRGEGYTTEQYDIYGGGPNILRHAYDVVLDLDSRDADDTCAASSGSVSDEIDLEQAVELEITRVATRGPVDERWTWSGTEDGEPIGGEAARISPRFYCGFRF